MPHSLTVSSFFRRSSSSKSCWSITCVYGHDAYRRNKGRRIEGYMSVYGNNGVELGCV